MPESKKDARSLSPLKLVTIIADDILQEKIIADLKSLGVRGYTLSEASGEGLGGRRDNDWEGRNVEFKTVVAAEAAQQLMELLAQKYFDRYGVIAYVTAVEVFRRSKFVT
jgi:hypothetical protein